MARVTTCLLLLALGASPALAATAAGPGLANGAGAPEPRFEPADIAAFQSARVPLLQAVRAVQARASGRVLAAAFTDARSSGAYVVTVLAQGVERELQVDAATGAVTAQTEASATPVASLSAADKGEIEQILHARTDLAKAIVAAQREGAGSAIATGYEVVRGTTYYVVRLVSGGTLRTCNVDMQSGLPRPQG